jgi:hypothetical protein
LHFGLVIGSIDRESDKKWSTEMLLGPGKFDVTGLQKQWLPLRSKKIRGINDVYRAPIRLEKLDIGIEAEQIIVIPQVLLYAHCPNLWPVERDVLDNDLLFEQGEESQTNVCVSGFEKGHAIFIDD